MAELKACQSASQSASVRAKTGSRQAIRNFDDLATLATHLLWSNSNKSDINLLSISRAAPATNKNNSQCNSIKGFPKHTQSLMSKYCQKVDFNWAQKLQKFHCNCCCCCYCWLPPCGAFRGCRFPLQTLIWHLLITQTLLPAWSLCGAIRALIAGRAQLQLQHRLRLQLCVSLKPFTYAIE